MENKNNMFVFGTVFLVAGVLIGWFCFSNKQVLPVIQPGTHMMGNGHMMSDNNMGMGDMMDSMMMGLNGKTGDAFDKAFIDEMIVHHEGAVDMAEAALKNAKHQEIKDMANAIISAQTKEIIQMKEWRSSWYGN